MPKHRAKTILAIVTGTLIGWCTEASADLLPPPPVCDASLLGEPCDGTATTTGHTFEGSCMKGVDGAFYCRVDTQCYPIEPSDPTVIAPEPCPAEAVDDDYGHEDTGEEGCAVGRLRTEATSGALATVGALLLLVLGRRRRRKRR